SDGNSEFTSSSSQYLDAFEYQHSNHDSDNPLHIEQADHDPYLSDSFELPPRIDLSFTVPSHDHAILNIEELNTANTNTIAESSDNEAIQIPRKHSPRVHSIFPFPPQGELAHPFEGWLIDKVERLHHSGW